jgi:hypothetical protein
VHSFIFGLFGPVLSRSTSALHWRAGQGRLLILSGGVAFAIWFGSVFIGVEGTVRAGILLLSGFVNVWRPSVLLFALEPAGAFTVGRLLALV